MGRFNLKKEDVTTTDMSWAVFLIAHPKGNLIWTPAIPDNSWTPTGRSVTVHVTLPDGRTREATWTKTLQAQLAEIALLPIPTSTTLPFRTTTTITPPTPRVPSATWLVRQAEREPCLVESFSGSLSTLDFFALQKSKTTILKDDEYDVFGDASVII